MLRRESTCRLCGTPNTLTNHHVIPQRHTISAAIADQRAPSVLIATQDVRDRRNIVKLCRLHHDAIDDYRILRSLLRSHLTEAEVTHITHAAGPEWFDAAYPPDPRGITP